MIDLDNVCKTYSSGVDALNNINIHIDKGEFVFIVGESGSGKSTLIKLLLRELEPTSGRIVINGKNISRIRRRKLYTLRRDIGVVFQDFRLLEDRNVFDNIAFAQKVIEAPGRKIRSRVHAMLAEVKITNKYKEFPKHLSGGEQQRVAIARALAKNPKILLCDEPTGALDYNTGKAILKLLYDTCRERNVTVIVITHNLALTAMGDKVIKVKNGLISGIEINENPLPVERIEW